MLTFGWQLKSKGEQELPQGILEKENTTLKK